MRPATTRSTGRGLGDPALLRAMADPATYGASGEVAVHETHASWVFVAGPRAYKVKKPVSLGFLDYATLERRRAACREEVRVNGELAPGVYLGVRAIAARGAGSFELVAEDDPGAVEYAVEMRSFQESDTLAGRIAAGSFAPRETAAVAHRIAAFHRAAPVACCGGGASDVLDSWRRNLRELAASGAGWSVSALDRFGEAFVARHAEEIEQRKRAGLVRDGHGDLRCEHILLEPEVRVVDRVEFDPALRRADIASDVAFLAMDLEALGQRRGAEELVRAYRREGLDLGSDELLSFYAAQRALVRAKVALVAAAESAGDASARHIDRARSMWELAERLCWRARGPLALVICGSAASGKSTLAAELSRHSGLTVLSSDAMRKSAAGIAESDRGTPELYSRRFTRLAYELLGMRARLALDRRHGVIVDATCRSRDARTLLLARLRTPGVILLLVRCTVSLEVALERAELRLGDPRRVSDATVAVVAEQHRSFQAIDELAPREVLELDAERPLGEQVAEVACAIDRLLAAGGTSAGAESGLCRVRASAGGG